MYAIQKDGLLASKSKHRQISFRTPYRMALSVSRRELATWQHKKTAEKRALELGAEVVDLDSIGEIRWGHSEVINVLKYSSKSSPVWSFRTFDIEEGYATREEAKEALNRALREAIATLQSAIID